MNWKEAIGKIAPELGRALGGPLAGYATSLICEKLGLPTNSTESEIEQHLKKHPEDILKAKQIEADLQIKLSEHGIQTEKIHAEDRDSARQREMAIKDHMPGILAIFITIGFFATLYQVFVKGVAHGVDSMLIGALLGTLGTAWISVVTYYFGSSSESQKKNNIIAASSHR